MEFPELPYREVYIKPYRFFYRIREDKVWMVALWRTVLRYPTNPRAHKAQAVASRRVAGAECPRAMGLGSAMIHLTGAALSPFW